MGLARLRKSLRIVNHPLTPSELIAAAGTASQTRRKAVKKPQLFHLLIISTTVKPIFCCICNSRSSFCTTDLSRHLSCRLIDEVR